MPSGIGPPLCIILLCKLNDQKNKNYIISRYCTVEVMYYGSFYEPDLANQFETSRRLGQVLYVNYAYCVMLYEETLISILFRIKTIASTIDYNQCRYTSLVGLVILFH